MAYGICDIPRCQGHTYMGWRPLTEQRGYQICKPHALRHRNPEDKFDLFEMFGLKRPAEMRKPKARTKVAHCACGRERLPGHKLCTACAVKREQQRKKRSYHERRNRPKPELEKEPALKCKSCGAERKRGHTYCPKCGEARRKQSNRERRRRHYRKSVKGVGLM